MALEIVMPRLSDSMEEGTIVSWLVRSGDQVDEGTAARRGRDGQGQASCTRPTGRRCGAGAARLGGESVRVGAPIALLGEPGESVGVVRESGGGARRGASRRRAAARALAAEPTASRRQGVAPGAPARGRARRRPRRRSRGRARRARDPRRRRAGRCRGGTTAPAATGDHVRQRRIDGPHSAARSRRSRAGWPSPARRSRTSSCARRSTWRSGSPSCASALREVADPPPSINDFIVRAAALALREFPRVNGAYRDGAVETFERVNVGIAVAAEETLLVPTIFDADTKSVAEIARVAAPCRPRSRRLDHAGRAVGRDVHRLEPGDVRDRQLLGGDQPAPGGDPRGGLAEAAAPSSTRLGRDRRPPDVPADAGVRSPGPVRSRRRALPDAACASCSSGRCRCC